MKKKKVIKPFILFEFLILTALKTAFIQDSIESALKLKIKLPFLYLWYALGISPI